MGMFHTYIVNNPSPCTEWHSGSALIWRKRREEEEENYGEITLISHYRKQYMLYITIYNHTYNSVRDYGQLVSFFYLLI